MCDHKAEMERKKARLAALREEKKFRRELRVQQDAAAAALGYGSRQCDVPSNEGIETLDHMLSSVGLAGIDDVLSHLQNESAEIKGATPTKAGPEDGTEPRGVSNKTAPCPKHRVASLSRHIRAVVDYPPREVITYGKHTQTDPPRWEEADPELGLPTAGSFGGGDMPSSTSDKNVQTVLLYDVTETKTVPPKTRTKQLTDEESEKILQSDDFLLFFDRAARHVERALGESADIFGDDARCPVSTDVDTGESGRLLSLRRHFVYDVPRSSVVTSLDWSPRHPELIVAGYFVDRPARVDDGLCLIWNVAFKKRTPDYVFRCGSRVTASKFAEFHQSLVIGGTDSGQVVLWDMRSPRKTPVLQSTISAHAHTQSVCSLNTIGGPSSHSLVTTSRDGLVCTWSTDMLLKPQDVLTLKTREGKSVYPACADFPYKESGSFTVGSESGSVHHVSRRENKAGVTESFAGHHGPVTQVSYHTVRGGDHLSHVYLTSSFDRSVKLWSRRRARPIHVLDDYGEVVLDVQWSPTHPCVFAVVAGDGRLQLWNLNEHTFNGLEGPAAETTVENSPALNKVSWSHSGRQIAVGDDSGIVWVYDVGEKLVRPTENDWVAATSVFNTDGNERDESGNDVSRGFGEFVSP